MLLAVLTTLLVALVVVAAPTTAPAELSAPPAFNSTPWTPGQVLHPHQVLLFGQHPETNESRLEVVHREVYERSIRSGGIFDKDDVAAAKFAEYRDLLPSRPEIDTEYLEKHKPTRTMSSRQAEEHAKRCTHLNTLIIDKTQTFFDWDIQMSPVIASTAPSTSVMVGSGYSAGNSIGVSVGEELKVIEGVLSESMKIDYSFTWTTSFSSAVTFVMTPGFYGAIVTNPSTTRHYGRLMRGCLGSQKVVTTFIADHHKARKYNGVNWVQGVVSLCQKKDSPLTRCEGYGEFI